MRTGVAYLGHPNPAHLRTDLRELQRLGCADVVLAAQEIDFAYFPGKLRFLPPLAADLGLRPIVLFWGALNLFGGGRSSQFLLDHPQCHQQGPDGSWRAAGCYNHPACVAHLQSLIDRVAELGYAGYFIDEPQPLECYCGACRELFSAWHPGGDLRTADGPTAGAFRRRCVAHYIRSIAGYVKRQHSAMETFCCIPPGHASLWPEVARIDELDNLGTDLYWANEDPDGGRMRPVVRELAALCRDHGKKHHQWLQCWGVRAGNEGHILTLGKVLAGERPDGLYVWAFAGQVGTNETCEDPQRAWENARAVLRDRPSG